MADMPPDIIAERLAVVFCGINPGMMAAAFEGGGGGRGSAQSKRTKSRFYP
jgi:hypothetical protein